MGTTVAILAFRCVFLLLLGLGTFLRSGGAEGGSRNSALGSQPRAGPNASHWYAAAKRD